MVYVSLIYGAVGEGRCSMTVVRVENGWNVNTAYHTHTLVVYNSISFLFHTSLFLFRSSAECCPSPLNTNAIRTSSSESQLYSVSTKRTIKNESAHKRSPHFDDHNSSLMVLKTSSKLGNVSTACSPEDSFQLLTSGHERTRISSQA